MKDLCFFVFSSLWIFINKSNLQRKESSWFSSSFYLLLTLTVHSYLAISLDCNAAVHHQRCSLEKHLMEILQIWWAFPILIHLRKLQVFLLLTCDAYGKNPFRTRSWLCLEICSEQTSFVFQDLCNRYTLYHLDSKFLMKLLTSLPSALDTRPHSLSVIERGFS